MATVITVETDPTEVTLATVATVVTVATLERSNDCIICHGEKPSDVIRFQESCKCNPVIHPECLHDWLQKEKEAGCVLCKKSITEAFEREKGYKKTRFYCNSCYGGCIAGSLVAILLVLII